MEIISHSLEQTLSFAYKLAKQLKGGEIIELNGQMGAGKTVFSRGLARGLGIKSHITSPTFSILNIYKGDKFNLCHYDCYRLNDENELFDCGLDEYFGQSGNICIIEWAQKINLSGYKTIKVNIDYLNENTRKIEVCQGEKYELSCN